jgi:hypothetical protein
MAFQWGRNSSTICRELDFAGEVGESDVSGIGLLGLAAGCRYRNPNQHTRLKSITITATKQE